MSLRLLFDRFFVSVLVAGLIAVGCLSPHVRVSRSLTRVRGVVSSVARSRSSRSTRESDAEELRAAQASETVGGGSLPRDQKVSSGLGSRVACAIADARTSRLPRGRSPVPLILRI